MESGHLRLHRTPTVGWGIVEAPRRSAGFGALTSSKCRSRATPLQDVRVIRRRRESRSFGAGVGRCGARPRDWSGRHGAGCAHPRGVRRWPVWRAGPQPWSAVPGRRAGRAVVGGHRRPVGAAPSSDGGGTRPGWPAVAVRGDRDEDQQQPEREGPGHDALGPGGRAARRPSEAAGTRSGARLRATPSGRPEITTVRRPPGASLHRPSTESTQAARASWRSGVIASRTTVAASTATPASPGSSRALVRCRRRRAVEPARAARRQPCCRVPVSRRRSPSRIGIGPRDTPADGRRSAPGDPSQRRRPARPSAGGAGTRQLGTSSSIEANRRPATRRRRRPPPSGSGAKRRPDESTSPADGASPSRRSNRPVGQDPGRCTGSSGAGRRARGGGGMNGPPAGHAREEFVGTPVHDVPAWLVLVVVEGGVAPCVVWHDRFLVLFTGLRG